MLQQRVQQRVQQQVQNALPRLHPHIHILACQLALLLPSWVEAMRKQRYLVTSVCSQRELDSCLSRTIKLLLKCGQAGQEIV